LEGLKKKNRFLEEEEASCLKIALSTPAEFPACPTGFELV